MRTYLTLTNITKFLAVVLCLGAYITHFLLSSTAPAGLLFSLDRGFEYQTTAQILSNAIFMWRIDPLHLSLLTLVSSDFSIQALSYISSLVFGLGCGALIYKHTNQLVQSLASAILIGSIMPTLFGFDLSIHSTLCYLPYCILALCYALETKKLSPLALISLGCCSLLLAASANQFSLPLAFVIIYAARSLSNITLDRTAIYGSSLLLLIPCLVVQFSAPALSLPNYPLLAHVVPDDNISGHIGALVGPSTAIAVIDRVSLKDSFSSLALIVGVFSLLGFFAARNSKQYKIALGSLALSVVALLDTLFVEQVAQISPLASLSRITPGLFYLNLTPICIGVALLLAFVALSKKTSLLIAPSCALLLIASFSLEAAIPNFLTEDRIYSAKLFSAQEADAKTSSSLARAKLRSPSLRLITEYSARPINEPKLFLAANFESPDFEVNVSVSNNQDTAHLVFDGNPQTAWNSGASSQTQGEWIHFYFPTPVSLDGIKLSTGAFRWDFPRGVEIKYLKNCTPSATHSTYKYSPIVEKSSWQGKVLYNEQGYPFYGGQDSVEIVFRESIQAQCLVVTQTSSHPHFRWSVAEVGFLLSRHLAKT